MTDSKIKAARRLLPAVHHRGTLPTTWACRCLLYIDGCRRPRGPSLRWMLP